MYDGGKMPKRSGADNEQMVELHRSDGQTTV
jgi:hypothetical protein